jgi:hypothetical protein
MPEVNEVTVAKAQEEFLGRMPVIGVGLAEKRGKRLAFVFANDSTKMKLEIRRWARRHHVGVDIHVAGATVPAT